MTVKLKSRYYDWCRDWLLDRVEQYEDDDSDVGQAKHEAYENMYETMFGTIDRMGVDHTTVVPENYEPGDG